MSTEILILAASITIVMLVLFVILLVALRWKIAFSSEEGEKAFQVIPSGVLTENSRAFRKLRVGLRAFEKGQGRLFERITAKNDEIAKDLIASDDELRSDQQKTNLALKAVLQAVQDLREETRILRSQIDLQAAELERHKQGYDVDILSTALIPIARMHRVLLEDLESPVVSEEAKNTLRVLEDTYLGVLETKGVQLVYPINGERYQNQTNIQHPPSKVTTNSHEQAGTIASVVHPAYELETSARRAVLLPAVVEVFSLVEEPAEQPDINVIQKEEKDHG